MNETVSLEHPTCHKTSHNVHGAMSHQRTLALPGPRLALAVPLAFALHLRAPPTF